jgi:hypothetical protein
LPRGGAVYFSEVSGGVVAVVWSLVTGAYHPPSREKSS